MNDDDEISSLTNRIYPSVLRDGIVYACVRVSTNVQLFSFLCWNSALHLKVKSVSKRSSPAAAAKKKKNNKNVVLQRQLLVENATGHSA